MPHPSLRRSPALRRFDHGEPIRAIDTRPMLFVAVLFLLFASQTRTHALLVPLQVPSEFTGASAEPPPFYRIALSESYQLKINGNLADMRKLEATLDALKDMNPRPEIVFEPEANAPYEASLHVIGAIWQAGLVDARFCFGGLEKHRNFGRSGTAAESFPDAELVMPHGCTSPPLYRVP